MSVCGLTASVGRRIHLAIVREVSSLAETLRLRRDDSSPSAWEWFFPTTYRLIRGKFVADPPRRQELEMREHFAKQGRGQRQKMRPDARKLVDFAK